MTRLAFVEAAIYCTYIAGLQKMKKVEGRPRHYDRVVGGTMAHDILQSFCNTATKGSDCLTIPKGKNCGELQDVHQRWVVHRPAGYAFLAIGGRLRFLLGSHIYDNG